MKILENSSIGLTDCIHASASFTNKVKSIPVVESTCDWLCNSYIKLKSTNFVTNATFNMAECTLKNSLHLATPLLKPFQAQVDALDSLACTQLDRIEHAFPIIKTDTGTLVCQGKDLLNNWTVQSAVNHYNQIKTGTEFIYKKSCELSDLRAQTRQLATRLCELTDSLIEKNLLRDQLVTLKKNDEVVLSSNERLLCYLNYKEQVANSSMSLTERSKTLSLLLYFCVQDKLLRQLNESIEKIKATFVYLNKLLEMYEMFKRNVACKLQDQFHARDFSFFDCLSFCMLLLKKFYLTGNKR